MTAVSTPAVEVVTARPVRSGRIANAAAAVALVVFVAVAVLMRRLNAGATFHLQDQIFTLVLGVLVAAGLHLPARPRLRADADGVHLKGYVGAWRHIPWDAIVAVEFPTSVRFARVRLPADESLAIYAVQRMDRALAVDTMRRLRILFAARQA